VAVQANGTLLVDRYRVIRRLGAGGSAAVFLCEDERLGREVAVKRLHAHSPEDMTRRLRREARLGASLSHPGLVSVFDTVTDDEGVLIVMEYVDGETLADALRRGPLPAKRVVEILRALASALDYVHAQGVVHRDVKPANVLLRTDGAVKLADLGVGLARDHTRITQAGQVLGTPAYMSPEQIDGASPTPAMDIYALGAIAYEMLSGEKARQGNTPLEVARHATEDPPPDLRAEWRDAPPAAAEAIKRAMAHDPARRPATAGELADELERALSGPPTEATRPLQRTEAFAPPMLPPVLPVAARRARGRVPSWAPLAGILLVLGAAVAVLALAGGGGSSGSGGSKSSASAKHHKRTHRSHAKKQAAATQPAQAPAASTTPSTATQDPAALNNEGKALIDQGRPSDAIPVLQRALAAFPKSEHSSIVYGWTLFNLGDAYLKSGQPQQAIPYLRARLAYPGQTDLVRAELEQAIQQAGGGAAAPGPAGQGPGKSKKKGHGKSG
jgi:eukaryotic-like serine/threonine-protein kinase